MRETVLMMIYESCKDQMPITPQHWLSLCEGYDIIPVIEHGELLGGAMVRGSEIHIGLKRTPSYSHRHQLKTEFQRLLRNGPLKTMVSVGNEDNFNFCRRLGFTETGRDEQIIHLELKESRYA